MLNGLFNAAMYHFMRLNFPYRNNRSSVTFTTVVNIDTSLQKDTVKISQL